MLLTEAIRDFDTTFQRAQRHQAAAEWRQCFKDCKWLCVLASHVHIRSSERQDPDDHDVALGLRMLGSYVDFLDRLIAKDRNQFSLEEQEDLQIFLSNGRVRIKGIEKGIEAHRRFDRVPSAACA